MLVPVIITQISSDRDDGRQREPSKSRMKERCCGRRGLAAAVLERRRQRQPAEDERDHGLADHLGLAAQAEAALLGDLDVVVEEADRRPCPTNRKSSSSADADGSVCGDQLGQEVGRAPPTAMITTPPMVGRAALGVVAGRAVVADLLAVARAA